MQEDDLIQSVKNGNNHAFEILMNQYKDMVFSICIQLTEDYHLAEEAAQDSFMNAYQQIHRFRGESKFSSWLYRISVNTSYNTIRQRKPVEDLENVELDTSSDELSGFEQLALEDQRNCIKLALTQLNKLDALLISLYYMEEQSIDELSIISSLSKANVKVKLHRARKKLKEIMQTMPLHK